MLQEMLADSLQKSEDSRSARSSLSKPKSMKYRFLVSACLAGINCTYSGKNNLNPAIQGLYISGKCLPVCPEVMGGLPTPRYCAEIVGGDGMGVLCGKARVIDSRGSDVTGRYLRGVSKIVRLAGKYKVKKAILKSNSPACGKGRIYDGTFKGVLRKGDGILASALKASGIKIYSEKDLKIYNRRW